MRFERCRTLFGEDFQKIQRAKVLILGVGGVGSFALDCLYRSGVGSITIVDFDRYDITNQNRQIGSEALGEIKVEVLAKLYPGITAINAKVDKEWIAKLNCDEYDVILDCIDDRHAKVELLMKCPKKIISSMGSAKKCDPTKIQVASIWKTHGDPFARKIRYELKKRGFKDNLLVVFSPEEAKCQEKGSFVAVTGAFGLVLCSQAIETIIKSS